MLPPIVSESAALRLDNILFTLEPLSVNDYELTGISIFPNPVKDVLTIESVNTIEGSELYTINGKLIASYSNTTKIDFTSLPKGVYLLKIKTAIGTEVKKIIK